MLPLTGSTSTQKNDTGFSVIKKVKADRKCDHKNCVVLYKYTVLYVIIYTSTYRIKSEASDRQCFNVISMCTVLFVKKKQFLPWCIIVLVPGISSFQQFTTILKACAQRFRYALFAFIHTQTYFEYYTLTLRLASLVKRAVIYAYWTKELFDICRENVSHMATLPSVARHVIHADNLHPHH